MDKFFKIGVIAFAIFFILGFLMSILGVGSAKKEELTPAESMFRSQEEREQRAAKQGKTIRYTQTCYHIEDEELRDSCLLKEGIELDDFDGFR